MGISAKPTFFVIYVKITAKKAAIFVKTPNPMINNENG